MRFLSTDVLMLLAIITIISILWILSVFIIWKCGIRQGYSECMKRIRVNKLRNRKSFDERTRGYNG